LAYALGVTVPKLVSLAHQTFQETGNLRFEVAALTPLQRNPNDPNRPAYGGAQKYENVSAITDEFFKSRHPEHRH
jgi:hypothetical protein